MPPTRTLRISLIREFAAPRLTDRMRTICWEFGATPREEPAVIAESFELTLRPGMIVLLSGPSGAGKTSLLNEIARRLEQVSWVDRRERNASRSVVDGVAPRRPLAEALRILTACGLGEPRLWLRRADELSDGERFRAALARAVGRAWPQEHRSSDRATLPVLCDEFAALLHRRLARGVACNLRKLATRTGLTFILTSVREDFLDELQPDQHVRLNRGAAFRGASIPSRAASLRDSIPATTGTAAPPTLQPTTLRCDAFVEPGTLNDYRDFARLHYRQREALGFVDRVFLLRGRGDPDPLGIVVFAHAPIELHLRNLATAGRFFRNGARLNRELRILRRLVMHPDVRGCGLGHWFVRHALPRAGVRFVECLAAMGLVNPVFEKAGMTRVGLCPLPRGRIRLLNRIRLLRIDPFSPRFDERIRRNRRVRELVLRTIRDWRDATRGGPDVDLGRKPPPTLAATFRQLLGEPPVYYLWDREGDFPIRRRCADPAADPSAARPHDPRRPPDGTNDSEGRDGSPKDRHRP